MTESLVKVKAENKTVSGFMLKFAKSIGSNPAERERIKKDYTMLKQTLTEQNRNTIAEFKLCGSFKNRTAIKLNGKFTEYPEVLIIREKPENTEYKDMFNFLSEYDMQADGSYNISAGKTLFNVSPTVRYKNEGEHIDLDYNTYEFRSPEKEHKRYKALNRKHNNIVTPVIRLLKYWNALNGLAFTPDELKEKTEQIIFYDDSDVLKGFTAATEQLFVYFESFETQRKVRYVQEFLSRVNQLSEEGKYQEAVFVFKTKIVNLC